MKKVLIDTNIYTAFKYGATPAKEMLQAADYIGINITVIGELLSGFKFGDEEKRNRCELDIFLDSPRVNVINIDETTAEFYSNIYIYLRKKGRPIPANDMWIAASAMQHGLILLSRDSHFYNIDGLLLQKLE